ncbi:MAG: putative lipase [Agarilytica sp.]
MKILLSLYIVLIIGCSASIPYVPEEQPLDFGQRPEPNIQMSIPGLSSCTDSPDQTLKLNSNHPITVLVHGCKGSAGRFRSLAELYAFHGQQAVCFSYDDRDSLVDSAKRLALSTSELSKNMENNNISIIGHSMGGLVARRALENKKDNVLLNTPKNISLATVSAPLAGIKAAETCGSKPLQWLSLGIIPGTCWIATGDNWNEITSSSDFIKRPRELLPSIEKYIKVVTDERDTCRIDPNTGQCHQSDFVFDLFEQYHPVVDKYHQTTNIEVNAGHVEIVGYKGLAPRKLIKILQENEMLFPTPPERQASLEKLLATLYD